MAIIINKEESDKINLLDKIFKREISYKREILSIFSIITMEKFSKEKRVKIFS